MNEIEKREMEILQPYFDMMRGKRVLRSLIPPVVNPVLDLYREEGRLGYDRNENGETIVFLRPKGEDLTKL